MSVFIPTQNLVHTATRILLEADEAFFLFYPYKNIPAWLVPALLRKTAKKPVNISIVLSQLARAKNIPPDIGGCNLILVPNLCLMAESVLPMCLVANERIALTLISGDDEVFLRMEVAWVEPCTAPVPGIAGIFEYMQQTLAEAEIIFSSQNAVRQYYLQLQYN
jgi:hypothetical protein